MSTLYELGMLSLSDPFIDYRSAYVVVIDGKIVGYVQKENGINITKQLRYLKLTNKDMVNCTGLK